MVAGGRCNRRLLKKKQLPHEDKIALETFHSFVKTITEFNITNSLKIPKQVPADTSYSISILVFKTNLSNINHIRKVKPALNLHPYIKEWNVDLQDCDNILRVVAENIPAREIEQIIINAGYYCTEL